MNKLKTTMLFSLILIQMSCFAQNNEEKIIDLKSNVTSENVASSEKMQKAISVSRQYATFLGISLKCGFSHEGNSKMYNHYNKLIGSLDLREQELKVVNDYYINTVKMAKERDIIQPYSSCDLFKEEYDKALNYIDFINSPEGSKSRGKLVQLDVSTGKPITQVNKSNVVNNELPKSMTFTISKKIHDFFTNMFK